MFGPSKATWILCLALGAMLPGCPRDPPPPPAATTSPPVDEPPADAAREAPDEGRSRPTTPPEAPPVIPAGITVLRRDAITLALSGDGHFLAAGDLGGTALLWDLSRGHFLWDDVTPEGNRLGHVVFAAAAPIYLTGAFDKPDRPWRAWSAEALERRGELGEPGWLGLAAALDDAGRRAFTLSSSPDRKQQRLDVWDLTGSLATAGRRIEGARRGAVAMDAKGERFAASDDRGAVWVYRVDDDDPGALLETFHATTNDRVEGSARLARLALSADGGTLYGSADARLFVWKLGAEEVTSDVVDVGTGDRYPIRGLHRSRRSDGVDLVVVTRPIPGGLDLYAADGRSLGHFDPGCRCETHALSADGTVAACGCSGVSELRWGRIKVEDAPPSPPE